jgi:antitoxin (DNA-binding transcriptional repressor) of toxin-antitoxin stability system
MIMVNESSPSRLYECIHRCQAAASLIADVVERVRKGTRFTVIYRSRPAFQIVPMHEAAQPSVALADDPLYCAQAVGRSRDGRTAADHDAVLYKR